MHHHNHVHLIAAAPSATAISSLMDLVEGVVRESYQGDIAATLAAGKLERVAQWTESLAVGGEAFVRQMSLQVEG